MRKHRNMKLRVKNLVEKYNTSNPYILCEKLNIEIRYFYYEGIKGFSVATSTFIRKTVYT